MGIPTYFSVRGPTARLADSADCFRYWLSGPNIQGCSRPSRALHILVCKPLVARVQQLGRTTSAHPEPRKENKTPKKKQRTVALHVHVSMVILASSSGFLPQNTDVTFDLIFVDRRCEISMLFCRNRTIGCHSAWADGFISGRVPLHFPALWADLNRGCTEQAGLTRPGFEKRRGRHASRFAASAGSVKRFLVFSALTPFRVRAFWVSANAECRSHP